MEGKKYIVYYNAVSIKENAAYLILFGWAYKSGWKPNLQEDGETCDFKFTIIKDHSDVSADVITHFAVTKKMRNSAKSIFVKDDFGRYQIHVNGLGKAKDGENTPGEWIESGKESS